ncbi:MAG: hypothetical protein A2Y33_15005 [Spirochaetes bacterium GWF1_51_8]|nr:MAG: hypothetical protein A2Y33_15005 [Spirochaetes bacterium GWF1_51_8]
MKHILFYIIILGLFAGCDIFKNSDLGAFLEQSKGDVTIKSASVTPDYYQVRVFENFTLTAQTESVKSTVVSVEADLTPIGLGIVSLEKNGEVWSNSVWAETSDPGNYAIVFTAVNEFGRTAVFTNTVRAFQYDAVYVAVWGSDSNSGLTNTLPVRTIQKAIQIFQNAGVGEIRVSEGVYDDYAGGACIQMQAGMKIKGGYESMFTAYDPELYPTEIAGRSNVFHVIVAAGGGNCSLDSLIISGGYAMDDFLFNKHGGGILALNTSLMIKNCLIKSNAALQCGGAVYAMGGSVTISNCNLSGNFSYAKGGSVFLYDTPNAVIRDTLISNTSSGEGGAVWGNNTALLTFKNLYITKSEGKKSGGIVSLNIGNFTIENTAIVSSATAQTLDYSYISGGIASVSSGYLTMKNCLFSNNTVSNTVAFGNVTGNGVYLSAITNGSITGSKFIKNFTYSVYGIHAGAVVLNGNSSASIISNIFSMNSNSTTYLSGGGGINLESSDDPVIINYNLFTQNYPAAIADGYQSYPVSVRYNGFSLTSVYYHVYGSSDIFSIADLNNLDSAAEYPAGSIDGNYDF